MAKTKRLEVLEASLQKKNDHFDSKFSDHVNDVKRANGQPMNDKRNGSATLNRWDRQSDSLRNIKKDIEKTEAAIEREKAKIENVEDANSKLPEPILRYVAEGKLNQWRKHPNRFFVPGVDKARIIWDYKTKSLCHQYATSAANQEQYTKFRDTYNSLLAEIKKVQQ